LGTDHPTAIGAGKMRYDDRVAGTGLLPFLFLRKDCPATIAFRGRAGTENAMLYWALVFLVVAVIAGLFGFGGIASTAAGIAQVLFFIFLIIFVVALVMGLMSRRGPPVV
jgi:uncharacterized membrane protein YtjA (UPF0391 family)